METARLIPMRFGPQIRLGLALGVFAAIHSAMASAPAKRAAERAIGVRGRNALYRPAFIGQSLVLSGWLLWLFLRMPDRVLYEVRGLWRWAMRLGQAAAIVGMYRAARVIGIGRVLGMPGLRAWFGSEADVPAEPEAQGPPLREDGEPDARGPFRISRHPLNMLPVPLIWLKPRMTVNWAILSALATLYFYVGSAHEEQRLRKRYGEPYKQYQQSRTPYFVPVQFA